MRGVLSNMRTRCLHLNKSKVVSITYQIKCFISMFLGIPHATYRYYATLLKANEDKIFVDTHSLYPYYISCLTCHLFENLVKNGYVDKKYKKFRYHILMMVKILLKGVEEPPLINEKRTTNYYSDIFNALKDYSKMSELFTQAVSTIDSIATSSSYKKYALNQLQLTRLKGFSTDLRDKVKVNKKFKT